MRSTALACVLAHRNTAFASRFLLAIPLIADSPQTGLQPRTFSKRLRAPFLETPPMTSVCCDPQPKQQLLTANQTAGLLGISPRKLWGMTASGDVPHVRLGRCLRYPAEELHNWIAENTHLPRRRSSGGIR